jgi:hypothetical protein
MNDEPSALVSRFRTMLMQVGCRGTQTAGASNNTGVLARRDLAEITAGAEALPGAWRVETADGSAGGVGRALLRPVGDAVLPSFAFVRRDGFITVRMTRPDGNSSANSLVFGVFASPVAALDAIHNDVAARQFDATHELASAA